MIGEYGSGKTFFLNLIRLVALEKGMVVLSADMAPDRRLHATGGQARSLYARDDAQRIDPYQTRGRRNGVDRRTVCQRRRACSGDW